METETQNWGPGESEPKAWRHELWFRHCQVSAGFKQIRHTHTHSLSHTHTLSLSLSHTHTHTLSLSLSHTHTHTLSLSPPQTQLFLVRPRTETRK